MTATPSQSQPQQTQPQTQPERAGLTHQATGLLAYLLVGTYFGVVLVKSEAASWYRIQEMFRFEAFHMFGLIGSAVVMGLITMTLLRRYGRTRDGESIRITPKDPAWRRYIFGGLAFGTGWGLAGVCPGPILALLGAGVWPMIIVLVSALFGTYLYGLLRERLPH